MIEEEELIEKIKDFELKAKTKIINSNPLYSRCNKYLYINQKREEDQLDLLKWLQTRINWSEEQK